MSDDDTRHPDDPATGVTRRGFLSSLGAGVVAATAVGAPARQAASTEPVESGAMVPLALEVNGRIHRLLVEPRWTLLFVLRERLGLTGTKVGCERGECGSCTVLLDDLPRYACMTLALEAEGMKITTVEGLMNGEELGPMQTAFVQEDALQCGYCTPGQIMAAEGLLRMHPDAGHDVIRHGMSGNLCRCGAYVHIVHAVEHERDARKARGGA